VKEEEEEKSSDEESSASRRSPLSAISSGRRVPVKEEAAQTREFLPHNSPPGDTVIGPPRYGSGSIRKPGWGRLLMQPKVIRR